MKKALNWCIVLVCAIAVLAGFAALLPQMAEAAGCQVVFKEQVGCCYNQRKFIHLCSDGSHFYSCSGICGPIP